MPTMTQAPTQPSRRVFLRRGARLAAAALVAPLALPARAATPEVRSLAFEHTHTGEKLSLVYAQRNQYLPDALERLNHLLRDHYSGELGRIDPRLFDLLFGVQQTLGVAQPFQVISGFRGAATNARLRETRGGGVASKSLHLEGRAVDIRIAGVALSALRGAALALQGGGVGFYAREQFVHIDTGRVRAW